MLLEEASLPVHMRAVEKAIAVNLLVIKRGGLLCLKIRVSFVSEPIFVGLGVCWLYRFGILRCRSFIESRLEAT